MNRKADNTPKRNEVQSFRINSELLHKLRHISLYTRKSQSEILEEVLQPYVERYEKKNGEIPTPKG